MMSALGIASVLLLLVSMAASPAAGQVSGAIRPDSTAAASNEPPGHRLPASGGGSARQALLSTPSGDTIAILGPNSQPVVLGEQGEWVHVRVEGWTRRGDPAAPFPISAPSALTLSEIRAAPDDHIGSIVRWTVQNLGLQRADSLRTDMSPGQNYLLVRDPGGETGMVYITVPEALLVASQTIGPLDRFEVVGRVVTGRSPLTGHPILEMLEIH